MPNLLSCLEEAIAIQQRHQDEEYKEMMSRPLRERVEKGYTMTNLKVEMEVQPGQPTRFCPPLQYPDGYIRTVHVSCPNNISKLREGSTVCLSHGAYNFKMDVEKDGIDTMILRSNDFDISDNRINVENYPKTGWEINNVNSDINSRLLKAIWATLSQQTQMEQRLTELLFGTFQNSYRPLNYYPSTNASQNTAIQKALYCNYFHIIQGPPGTGKTYTIAKIVARLVMAGLKVFVTAPTHTAINNCLDAISKELRDASKIIKIGEKYQAEEILLNPFITFKSRLSHYQFVNDKKLSSNGIVIGATPYALCYPASKKLEGWTFDFALFDESAQMSIPLALAAMVYSRRLIFVGDHKQLDPIIPADTDNVLLQGSVFKKLIDNYPNDYTLLDQSYRLNPELIRVPNQLFYDSRIVSAHEMDKPFINYSCNNNIIVNNISSELLCLHNQFDALGRSPYEAKIVAGIVDDLLENGVDVSEIGVMSPYRAQIREIKRALVEEYSYAEENMDQFFIDTVERMQGQEKDYIIYSLANCNPLEVVDRLDFFYSPNRLNVAITRAKIKLMVLANQKVFDLCDELLEDPNTSPSLRPGLEAFRDFRKYSTVLDISVKREW